MTWTPEGARIREAGPCPLPHTWLYGVRLRRLFRLQREAVNPPSKVYDPPTTSPYYRPVPCGDRRIQKVW